MLNVETHFSVSHFCVEWRSVRDRETGVGRERNKKSETDRETERERHREKQTLAPQPRES